MGTFRVKRTGLLLTSLVVEAKNSRAALSKAADSFERADKRNLRLAIDDDGDKRSESRYVYSDADRDSFAALAARWALDGSDSDSEATP